MLANEPIVVLAVVFATIVLALFLFKLTIRLIIGSALGLLLLLCISLLAEKPWFDSLTQGVFEQGVIIPQVRQMVPIEHISNEMLVRLFGEKQIANHENQENSSVQKIILQPVLEESRVIQVEYPKGCKKVIDGNAHCSSTVI